MLEAQSINYDSGYIFQPSTGNNISNSVPYAGAGLRLELKSGLGLELLLTNQTDLNSIIVSLSYTSPCL
jgi:hypothetical protein